MSKTFFKKPAFKISAAENFLGCADKTEKVKEIPGGIVSSLVMRAGLAASLMSLLPVSTTQAQNQAGDDNSTDTEQAAGEEGVLLETVIVSGAGNTGNVNMSASTTSRLPGTMRDVPQTVNVIPEKILAQQNISTLEQALANVPGITVSLGEGRGGQEGDRFRIRGFETFGDTYRDGLRDFGVYVRDSFNMEQVQVFKGPNGENFGVGTTGGAINAGTKRARLGTFGAADVSYGTGSLARTTADYNWQFNETSAVRFNLMGHWQDLADRDLVESNRWGGAASIGLGLGTDRTLHLDYMFQHNKRVPDYGTPVINVGGGISRPVMEYGVRRENFYGKDTDIDESDVHMLTASYTNEFNDRLTLYNDTRYAHYSRFYSATPITCNAACTTGFWTTGDGTTGIGGGGGPAYDQTSWSLQNLTTLVTKYELGSLRNEAVFGLDMIYQDDNRQGYRYDYSTGSAKINGTIHHPNHSSSNYRLVKNNGNWQDTYSTNIALFASNRLWFNDQWSVAAGLRWENHRTSVKSGPVAGAGIANADASWDVHFVNPKASLIWEPTPNQNYYFSWARSHNIPSGQNVSSDMLFLVSRFGGWKPEKSDLFELGTKLDFLDGNLGITAAIFWVEKDNSYDINAAGSYVASGDRQKVHGFEAGITGQITAQWSVYAAYSLLKSKILDSNTASDIGNKMQNVPKNSASLWTTYDLAPHFDRLEGQLLIGGGLQYRDAMPINAANTALLPHNISFDAMVSYETEKWNVALNAHNLTDRLNYDGSFGSRVVPSSGRTFTLKLGTKF